MGTAPRNNSSIDVQPGLDVVVEFPTGASIPEPPANAGQSSQSTIQTVNERYANIIFGANRLPNESGAEGCPIGPAADIVPDTKLEDQMEDPKRKSEQLLVKSTSTQTEQDGIHHDNPNQPLHQRGVDVIPGKRTEVNGNLGPQDTYPDAKNTGGNADKKAAKKHQDEHFSGAPPFKTDREAADYYYNKYRDLKSENTRLTNSRAELTTENSSLKTGNKKLHAENGQLRDANKQFWQENTQLHAENQQLQRALKEERNRSSAATKKGDQLKEQLDDLYRSHIHSINSVNTGLDPISDRTFEEKFGSIHDEIHNWCRKAFKHQPKTEIRSAHELVPDLQEALDKRRYLAHSISLRFGHFVETVTWIVLEDWVLSRWFPGLKQNDQEHCVSLHNRVRGGDTSSTPEKAEYWRAYTASLLFQNPQVQKFLQDVQQESDDLLNILSDVQTTPSVLPSEYISDFRRILRNLRTLGAQLRCQRAAYEIDRSVTIGEEYDESRMDGVQVADLENVDHRKERAYVTCILSNGIVKKKFEGSEEVEARICRARVLVTVVPIERTR